MSSGRIQIWPGRPFRLPAHPVAPLLLLTFVACSYLTRMAGQKGRPLPWLEKDWTQWTLEDINQVLTQSPWPHPTEHIALSGCQVQSASKQTLVQFRSALPVRQALLRQTQLDHHYDKLNPKKKLQFDQQHAADLSGGANDYFMVVIYNSSIDPRSLGENMNAPGYSCLAIDPDPPTQIFLRIQDGPPISPLKINKVKYASTVLWESINQYEYLFPRTVDGKPLFSPAGESFWIQRGDVLRLILGNGMAMVLGGVGVGLGVTAVFTRSISAQLYGIGSFDAISFFAAAVVLIAAALVACWLPARHAMRVDPIVALRYE